jgi:hypothetical protein
MRDTEAVADLEFALESRMPAAAFSTDFTQTAHKGVDLVMTSSHGEKWSFQVKSLSRADPSRVNAMVSKMRQERPDALVVLVADQVPQASRDILADAGWGYLDRRGHLRIMDASSHLFVDVDVDPMTRATPQPREPIRGTSGISYAAALLMNPTEPIALREVARRACLAVSTVSEAARSIRDAALIGRDGRPLSHDLFWALSDVWRPERIPLLDMPNAGEVATTNALGVFGDPAEPGWAVTGDVAAAGYGAPIAIGSGFPPDFYVPDRVTATNAARTYGVASDPNAAACTVAVAPTRLACVPRFGVNAQVGAVPDFFFTHALFVALDLASDKARGSEILSGWIPPQGFTRVW